MRHKIKNARQLFLVVLLHAFLEEKMVAISLQKSGNYVSRIQKTKVFFFQIVLKRTSLENLFFPKLKKKLMAPPKSMTNDVYLTPIEENLH